MVLKLTILTTFVLFCAIGILLATHHPGQAIRVSNWVFLLLSGGLLLAILVREVRNE